MCISPQLWAGGIRHNQLRNKSGLDRGHCFRELDDQQLHRIAERNLDWNRNGHNVRGNRPFSFDRLQLHSRGDGRQWCVGRKCSRECNDACELMHDQAECADGIGCESDDQLRHEPELDGGHCSREQHDQRLHRIAERNLIGTATAASFVVSGLSASTAYSFTVKATDARSCRTERRSRLQLQHPMPLLWSHAFDH
jgi:hypothetical protein